MAGAHVPSKLGIAREGQEAARRGHAPPADENGAIVEGGVGQEETLEEIGGEPDILPCRLQTFGVEHDGRAEKGRVVEGVDPGHRQRRPGALPYRVQSRLEQRPDPPTRPPLVQGDGGTSQPGRAGLAGRARGDDDVPPSGIDGLVQRRAHHAEPPSPLGMLAGEALEGGRCDPGDGHLPEAVAPLGADTTTGVP